MLIFHRKRPPTERYGDKIRKQGLTIIYGSVPLVADISHKRGRFEATCARDYSGQFTVRDKTITGLVSKIDNQSLVLKAS